MMMMMIMTVMVVDNIHLNTVSRSLVIFLYTLH